MTADYAAHLTEAAAAIAGRCTACGDCLRVCPVAAEIELPKQRAEDLTRGLKQLSQSGAGDQEAENWVEACDGSGACITACPEGLNVRRWMWLNRLKLRSRDPASGAEGAAQRFRGMARAVRLLAGLQMPNETFDRVNRGSDAPADVTFYTGCNILRTPHLLLGAIDILEALGISYALLGGTPNCCGILQFAGGDVKTSDRIAGHTYQRFRELGSETVLSWCPTCHIQFGDNRQDFEDADFALDHFTEFLASRLDDLRAAFVKPVPARVLLHEHASLATVNAAVRDLLCAIPELELLPSQAEYVGYACGSLGRHFPQRQARQHAALAAAAKAAGADTVVSIYHSCHRQLAAAKAEHPFDSRNYTELLCQALGFDPRRDLYKEIRLAGGLRAVLGDELDDDQVEFLESQILPEPGFKRPA
jgi:Fe-S oxidoreductase